VPGADLSDLTVATGIPRGGISPSSTRRVEIPAPRSLPASYPCRMCGSSVTRRFSACWFLVSLVGLLSGCASQSEAGSGSASGGSANSTDAESTPAGGASSATDSTRNPTTGTGGGIVTSGGSHSSGGSGLTSSGGTAPSGGATSTTVGSSATGGNVASGTGGNASSFGGNAGTTAPVAVCGTFPTKPTVAGTLFAAGIESSGIVASRKQPGVYWLHGDSGATLYAIDGTGKQLGQWEVTSDARFFFLYNWEDIAIQSVPGDGPDRIWVGDIGNHTEDAEGNPVEPQATLRLLSIDEPTVDRLQVITGTVKVIEDLKFEYPDGLFDSEALMIDPATNDAFVVSKTEASPSKIYRIAAPLASSTLEYIGTLDADSINAGDISPSGRELVVHSYMYLYYWALPAGRSWKDVLSAEPSVPDKKSRVQFTQSYFAEAICFPLDESGLFVVSEEQVGTGAAPSPVEFYPKSCK